MLAVGRGLAAHRKRSVNEHRPHVARGDEFERRRGMLACELELEHRRKTAVHYEIGIAFSLRHVGMIVVDTVAIEGERGIAIQHYRVWRYLFAPYRIAGCRLW